MSESKNAILNRLRRSGAPASPMPDFAALTPATYSDPVEAFVRASREQGCDVAELQPGETPAQAVRRLFPDAKQIASAVAAVPGNLDADKLTPQQLEVTDLAVARGVIGVAENGCVYIPQQVSDRSLLFLCQTLLILLDRRDIVDNMHRAYELVPQHRSPYHFGCFIAGPSKTADIAQVLVMGAQAARACTILLL